LSKPAATPPRLAQLNIENNPMQSSAAVAGRRDLAKTF